MRPKQRLPYVCLPVAGQSFWNSEHPDSRRTALREAAYIRRTKFENDSVRHDFACRSADLFMLCEILPRNAPGWARSPYLRWQMADEAVRDDDAAIRAWHICADLPAGMSRGQWMDQTEALIRSVLPDAAVAEICGHIPASEPPHIHALVAPRRPVSRRFGAALPNLPQLLQVSLRDRWLQWLQNAS